jgi:transcriptional regulator with XRE-family HTH domain
MARRSKDPKRAEDMRDSIGALVRDIRKRREMTLEQLAERTGISISSLSRIENTRLGLTVEKVEMLALALDVSPEILVSRNRRSASRRHSGSPRASASAGARFMVDRARERRASLDRELSMEYLFDRDTERSLDCLHLTVEAVNIWDSEFVRHPGEKIIYMISGAAVIYCEKQSPVVLERGDSLYMDAYVWHSIVAVNEQPAEMLVTYYHGSASGDGPFETQVFTPERWADAQAT